MRRIIAMMSVSIDGFFEGPNREIDWHCVDDEVHRDLNARLAKVGGFLDGRVTFELMAEFWPTADADPAATPTVAEFARIWREMPKWVYSSTLTAANWNTTIVREVVVEDVLALKAEPGGDLVLGGANLSATFMRHDLIDEYWLYVHPVVLGEGHPFWPAGYGVRLDLTDTQTFGNGVVLLRYRPRRPDQRR